MHIHVAERFEGLATSPVDALSNPLGGPMST